MTIKEIMDTIEREITELHKYDSCYLRMHELGLAWFFVCDEYLSCKNRAECPYSPFHKK